MKMKGALLGAVVTEDVSLRPHRKPGAMVRGHRRGVKASRGTMA